jgi:hypothetical protein
MINLILFRQIFVAFSQHLESTIQLGDELLKRESLFIFIEQFFDLRSCK